MAKRKKSPGIPKRRRPPSEASGFAPLLLIGLTALALFSIDAAIIMVIGIVPTIVLGFTGKGEHKAERLQCVGFSNVGGVIPFIPQAMSRGWEFMIGDIINIVLMFGSAAIGYALVYVGPMVAAFILQGLNQDRLKKIAQQRQALVDAWSHEVLGDKEDEAVPAQTGFIRKQN